MNVAIMITHGGPHPADTLAGGTAWKIADLVRVSDDPIDPTLPDLDRQAIEANREAFRQARSVLSDGIKDVLAAHHEAVQSHERAQIEAKGAERLVAAYDHPACDALCAEIIAKTKGTVLQAHFAKPDVLARVKDILDHDAMQNAHLERRWHADRNLDDPRCKQFRARHQPGEAAA